MTILKNKLRRKNKKKSRKCNFKGGKRNKKTKKNMRGGSCGCNSIIKGGRRRRRRKKRRSRKRLRKKRRGSRRRSRRRNRRSKTQLRGGSLQSSCINSECAESANIGELYTKVKYNKQPVLPDPKSLNSNLKNKVQKGGSLSQMMGHFGLGDALLSYYNGTNNMLNLKHRYKGNKNEVGANPMNQEKLIKPVKWINTTADIPTYYDLASKIAAEHTISN